jgi:hypothetical protein
LKFVAIAARDTGMRKAKAIVVTISLGTLGFLAGCSKGSQQTQTPHTAAPAATETTSPPQAAPPPSLAAGYPRSAEDTSRYDPEKEAEKIDIKLYPGARILSMPYVVRRGNYLQQRVFFATTDARDDVVKFYAQIYGIGTFQVNAAGEAAASIVQPGSRDVYLFKIYSAPSGETFIEVTENRTCDMYPAPCDEKRVRPPEDLSGYDPETEAQKIGIKLYPGAKIFSMPYAVQRGNYYQQRAFFATSDGHNDVVKFYDQIYGVGTFQQNTIGVAAASIGRGGPGESYLFKIYPTPDGGTHIEVTALRPCEKSPAPCGGSPN